MISRPWTAIFLASFGDGDRVAHADHALVLGGRGDLRLLQLLAGGGDPLLGNAARTPARSETRSAELISTRARLAHHRNAATEAAELLVTILDLVPWACRLLAGPRDAGELDECARRGRTGDDRLRDGLEDGLRRSLRRGRLCGHARTGGSGDSSAGRRCGRRRRGGGGRDGRRRVRRLRRRGSLDNFRLTSGRLRRESLGGDRRGRLGRARRRLRRSHGRRWRRGRGRTGGGSSRGALRATADDGIVEANLFQVLQPLAIDGPADAVDVDRLEMGHVIRHLDAHGADLVHQVFGREVQILRQLVETAPRPRGGFRFRSALVSTSHHGHGLSLSTRSDGDPLQQFGGVGNRDPTLEGT